MSERVLVVCAHADDEVLMAGGSIAKHTSSGDDVHILIIADGVSSRTGTFDRNEFNARLAMASKASDVLGCNGEVLDLPDNKLDTVPALDIIKKIEAVMEKVKPTIVYTHWPKDMNIDHRIVSECTQIACRPAPGCTVKQILFGEVPSSTEWAGGFCPNHFINITDTLSKKFEALACYEEEMRGGFHPRSIQSIGALAKIRGACIGVEAAEAFELCRGIS